MELVKQHAFKNRAATHDGKPVTVLRLANSGDAGAGLESLHFLVRSEAGEELVAPVAEVFITPAPLQFIETPHVEDKDTI